jgi:hypothetical protein
LREEVVKLADLKLHYLTEGLVHLRQLVTVMLVVHALNAHGHVAGNAEVLHRTILMLRAQSARDRTSLGGLLTIPTGVVVADAVPPEVARAAEHPTAARVVWHWRLHVGVTTTEEVVVGACPARHNRREEPLILLLLLYYRGWHGETSRGQISTILLVLSQWSSVALELLLRLLLLHD